MKKLIKKIFFFAIPILLVLLCIELFYRIAPNTFIVKREDVKRRFDNAEVLIFGNSHTFYGLNPKFFSKQTYNLANISQTLYFDNLLFEKYYCKFKKLDFIILNIDYESLSELDNGDDNVWRKYYYKSYMDLEVPIISVYNPKSYFLSSTRDFNTNVKLIERYFHEGTIVDCDENGFGINYTKEKRKSNFEELTPFRLKSNEDNSLDFKNNINRVQSIIDKCKNKGIQVILVTIPVAKGYAQGVNQQKLNKVFKTCLTLEKINSNVRYLNLFKDPRFTDDDFYDPDHLHNEGANKCSLIMNQFLSN
ncbi:hypothetical protein ACEN2I_14970 [Flavobacterium sp. W22_SRS_FK3]|uniref:hypothetical protein n=1 Tax=Flavobacterium sp. W22_SRS_FK3 TaxID=3240275 RepID=UPI003F900913